MSRMTKTKYPETLLANLVHVGWCVKCVRHGVPFYPTAGLSRRLGCRM